MNLFLIGKNGDASPALMDGSMRRGRRKSVRVGLAKEADPALLREEVRLMLYLSSRALSEEVSAPKQEQVVGALSSRCA